MEIYYEERKFIKENKEFEIEDLKNVFLKGKNPINGADTYFGIWENKQGLMYMNIIVNHAINYECSTDSIHYMTLRIKSFLEHNDNVEKITKNEFKTTLNNILLEFDI